MALWAKGMHGREHTRAGQEGAEDHQRVGQDDQHHVPVFEQAALFLDHHRVQEGCAGEPGHEGGDLHRIPAPVTAPTQDIISPAPSQDQSQREEKPGHQRPAAGDADPAVVSTSGDQRCDGKGEGITKETNPGTTWAGG